MLEEDKKETLGWSTALKATPRKGLSKEVMEEEKYRRSKKILFGETEVLKPVHSFL